MLCKGTNKRVKNQIYLCFSERNTTSRDIVRLHIMEGCKVADISERLQMNYKSVEYKLGTTRKVIRHYVKALKYA